MAQLADLVSPGGREQAGAGVGSSPCPFLAVWQALSPSPPSYSGLSPSVATPDKVKSVCLTSLPFVMLFWGALPTDPL